ncbi:response regulator transcription factor [Frankia tisae]|uniref:response regulator transcription factor n=1 Tax=Frankia tisae TaxID=2950104 RepID=UPI0021BE9E53|nr:response regulator transcription factor [Frankia tisae]
MKRVRIVLADDHPVVRSGLRGLLDTMDGIEVVAEAGTGQEAIDAVRGQRPDVVIMDLQMPDLDGITATRLIVAENPGIAVLVFTMFEDDDTVFAAMQAGARGYLLKGALPRDVERAIEAITNGEAIFGAAVAERIRARLGRGRAESAAAPFSELTDRERQILDLVATGANNVSIGAELHISTKTVANHVSNILVKLRAADRPEIIVRARRAGLGEP